MRDLFDAADIIAVSGGNTLFGVNRWKRLGVDTMLREASERGAVMVGGSAGAICWFDGGHSDSFDPTTVRACMYVHPHTVQYYEDARKAFADAAQGRAPVAKHTVCVVV
eukprot:COSAG01_NODE_14668_length_1423_cov_2.196375_2_plen_109_part_00